MLSNGGTIKIPYKNYGIYLGDALTNTKQCTVKITESTECLDKIVLSFMDNTFPNGAQRLLLGNPGANNANIPGTSAYAAVPTTVGTNTAADINALGTATNTALTLLQTFVNSYTSGKSPKDLFNYTNLLSNNDDQLLNTSLAFKRNGLGVGANLSTTTVGSVGTTGTVQFQINSQDITHPLSLLEQHQQTLQAFELNDDQLAQCNPAIKNLALYERDFYACAFSTSHINDKLNGIDYTLVSGLDTMAQAMNISVKVTQGRATDAAQAAVPILITEMTSHLVIGAGRNIMPVR